MEIYEPTSRERGELPRILALCGPTGVGKTELSLQLAERLGAELVNMDSVQVYRGLDIGSAKASPAERARVPHHLIDILAPDEDHNVGDFIASATSVIEDVRARGKHAIVVGGTGLYLRGVVHGLMEAPPPSPEIRARHGELVAEHGRARLHEMLVEVDPELAERLHPNDTVRTSRGLEVFEQTGRLLSVMQREHAFRAPNYDALKLALVRPRAQLYARIDRRVDAMIEEGLLEECRALFDAYPRDTKSLGSLGYRQLAPHLLDGVEIAECVQAVKKQTRRYAKQQLGWLRSEPGVVWAQAPLLDDAGRVPDEVVGSARGFLEGGDPDLGWADADPYQ